GLRGEVVPSRCLGAVRTLAVIGDVEVALQDLVLGELLLHRDRIAQLANLALHGRRLGVPHTLAVTLGLTCLDLHHLDVLLGDGRATLSDAALGPVAPEPPQWALEVQGAVLVVAVVFDGYLRLPHYRSDLVKLHRDAVLVVEVREGLAIAHQHLAAGSWCWCRKLSRQALQLGGRGIAGDPRHTRERDEQSGHENTRKDADDDEHHQRVREAPRALRRKRHGYKPKGAPPPISSRSDTKS